MKVFSQSWSIIASTILLLCLPLAGKGGDASLSDSSVVSSSMFKALDQALAAHSLYPVQESFRNIPGFDVHGIFHSFDLSQVVFLRLNVETSSPMNQLIPVDGGSVFFSEDGGKRAYAVYLMGIESAPANELMKTMRSALGSEGRGAEGKKSSAWRMPSLVSEAKADDGFTACRAGEAKPLRSRHVKELQSLSFATESAAFSSLAMSCLSGAWEGAKDELKGRWQDVKTLVTDPMEFARSLKRSWNSMVAFVSDFRANVEKSFSAIAALPVEAQTELFCGFMGSVGTPALIGMLAGGTGLSLAMKSSMDFLLRASRLQKMLAAISNAPSKMAGLQGFWKSLANGKISDRRLSTIETLSDRSMDLAYGAAACAI